MFIRKMIGLTIPQSEFVDAAAAKLGIKPAEMIRRILDEHRMFIAPRLADETKETTNG